VALFGGDVVARLRTTAALQPELGAFSP